MRRYLRIGAAWLGATTLSVVIASAAVAGIRDRVVETPVAIGLPTTTTTATPPTTPAPPSQIPEAVPITAASSTTTVAPVEPTTTEPPPTTVTTAPSAVVTTTTAAVATTTTTAAPVTTTTSAAVEYLTYDLVGGTVVLAVGNGEVNLAGATPRPGFSTDYEHTGPVEVEIKFESNDHKSKLEAHFDGGELKVDTEEETRGDDDD